MPFEFATKISSLLPNPCRFGSQFRIFHDFLDVTQLIGPLAEVIASDGSCLPVIPGTSKRTTWPTLLATFLRIT